MLGFDVVPISTTSELVGIVSATNMLLRPVPARLRAHLPRGVVAGFASNEAWRTPYWDRRRKEDCLIPTTDFIVATPTIFQELMGAS